MTISSITSFGQRKRVSKSLRDPFQTTTEKHERVGVGSNSSVVVEGSVNFQQASAGASTTRAESLQESMPEAWIPLVRNLYERAAGVTVMLKVKLPD